MISNSSLHRFYNRNLQPNARSNSPTYLQCHFSSTHHLDRSSKKDMTTLPYPLSFDEHLASLESRLLFMSSLPDDPADNVALRVLQSLMHDSTLGGRCVSSCMLGRLRSHGFGTAKRGHAELQRART
ncbi:hypothetical protein BJV78DRAFT_1196515 [Lactifluus subvellereus]|nr:hypothetical protein BJV78DRAFT_1196515 [Lactifluus subvellereus]